MLCDVQDLNLRPSVDKTDALTSYANIAFCVVIYN